MRQITMSESALFVPSTENFNTGTLDRVKQLECTTWDTPLAFVSSSCSVPSLVQLDLSRYLQETTACKNRSLSLAETA